MQKAKAAVSEFIGKSGHHDTTVDEKVAPSVTQEHIRKKEHENVTTAVDKEIHQDHYHTTVQPLQDREVLAEQHSHNVAPTEHREYNHGNIDRVQAEARHDAELNKFKDTRTVGETERTRSAQPVVAGEHRHHHVHETVQPVIQKETIAPSVVHTTVPIHETHHNEPQHHSHSVLPAMNIADFKNKGGVLGGNKHTTDHFEGEPVTSRLGGSTTGATTGGAAGGLTGKGRHHNRTGSSSSSSSDDGTGSKQRRRAERARGTDGLPTGTYGTHTGTTGTTGTHTGTHTGTTGNHTTGAKPGLMDKLNPRKDADGDGKPGFMD